MIFIVGPTATGKTALALRLAKELNADILSADSRQFYKGLEITTGADLPENFTLSKDLIDDHQYFTDGEINFYGVSFLKPNEEWSIAHFRDFAEFVYEKTQERNKELIIVGGSGLYHQALFLDKKTLHISPSEELREELQNATVEELQQKLLSQYPHADEVLNDSDWKNPRRLIRWIEKTTNQTDTSVEESSIFGTPENHSWIGLSIELEKLEPRIQERVIERAENGSIQEVEQFLAKIEDKKSPSTSTLGVKEISLFLNDQISKDELIELWTKHEVQYAKRQITWFKKRGYIKWLEYDKVDSCNIPQFMSLPAQS